MDANILLEVRNICFAHPGAPALLKELSFSLYKGECLGITGSSGSGKSTLALLLAGHLQPTSGEIWLNGRLVNGRPRRDIFLVHQENDLFPWLNVEDQIAFALEKQDPQHVKHLIQLTQLEGCEKRLPRELSGGMQKRLSLARALAVSPKVLILDEAFGSLDFELRLRMFAELKKIWEQSQSTIIVISHDPRDLEHIAQRELTIP